MGGGVEVADERHQPLEPSQAPGPAPVDVAQQLPHEARTAVALRGLSVDGLLLRRMHEGRRRVHIDDGVALLHAQRVQERHRAVLR
eukprot:3306681-Alexandrium_andersonii.AAC.1